MGCGEREQQRQCNIILLMKQSIFQSWTSLKKYFCCRRHKGKRPFWWRMVHTKTKNAICWWFGLNAIKFSEQFIGGHRYDAICRKNASISISFKLCSTAGMGVMDAGAPSCFEPGWCMKFVTSHVLLCYLQTLRRWLCSSVLVRP